MLGLVRGSILIACAAALAMPQESPLAPPNVFGPLSGEISGDIAYDHIRHLTLYDSPNSGSKGYRDKTRWVFEKAKQVGLEDVRLIEDLKGRGQSWTALSADLFLVSPEYRRLASYDEAAVALGTNSRSGTWEGELIDVGEGTREADYKGKDVKGKIVLCSGSPGAVMNQAVFQRGALGVVYYNAARGVDYPDQVAWIHLPSEAPKGKQVTFAFSLSYRAGMELKRRLAAGSAAAAIPGAFGEGTRTGEKLVLKATVQTEFSADSNQWMVEGWIQGTKIHHQAIVLTAHLQEEKYSANDDNSGLASLLEIGRALQKLIREGRLARPVRDLRFWWCNEISGEYAYFAAHPEERGKVLANINQDMVGAKQSLGARIQHITRTPDSRPSFLNDVMESIALTVARGNTAYLSAGQAGSRTPFSKPIVARFGTRDRYGVEIVPFFTNTDHMVFNDAIIGVPGVTLTNWPDPYIHSSDDDLWQVDATQLQRNAFVVAAAAYYLAALEPAGVPVLAAQVHTGVGRSLNNALARATEMLALAPPSMRPATYHDGVNLIEQATRRAAATLDSLGVFEPEPPVKAQLEEWKKAVSAAGEARRNVLAEHYRLLTGQAAPAPPPLSDLEKRMSAKVPEIALGVAEYIEKRFALRGSGLHGVMAYELPNFVDGRRSYLDIYRALRAEAQAAGEWYYGTVTAKAVDDALESGVKSGLLRLKR